MGLVNRHGGPRAKRVGANIVRLEPQALEANLGGMNAEEEENVGAGDAFRKHKLGEKVGADGYVRSGIV